MNRYIDAWKDADIDIDIDIDIEIAVVWSDGGPVTCCQQCLTLFRSESHCR
jgi:hypothetical protein